MTTVEDLLERFPEVFRAVEEAAFHAHTFGDPHNRPPVPSVMDTMWRTAEMLIDELGEPDLAQLADDVRRRLEKGTGLIPKSNQEEVLKLLNSSSKEEQKAALIVFFARFIPGR